MAAGDNFFAGIYLQESDPRGRIRGTIAKAPQGDSHTGTHEVIVGETKNIDQGPMFPSLDFSGPKNYFISLVTRTYKSISANLPTGSVYSGAIPAVMQYTGPPTNPSFKIQIGSFYQDPTDPLTYSDDSGEGGQWPKIVLPGDSDWQTAENPLYVYSYRKLGTNYNPDEFQFRTGNPSSYDDLSYPAYPIVSNNFANEFSTYVVYDTITRKLLPQAYEPVSIPTFPNSVALGQQCAFAITSNNSVFSWGHNHQLQRSTIDSYENTNVNMIAASYNGAVVLMSSGLVQVVGFTGIESMQPPHDLPSSSYVAATNKILAAIAQNENSVTCWGEGPDEYNLRTPPQDLAGACTQISGGKNHFAALRSDGKVICWGDNTYNQCSVPPLAQSNVVKVVCGAFHTVALKNNGQVICWGSNNWEQSNVPVNLGIGCLDIAAGQYHTVAIKSNRTLSAWGAINNAETTPTDLCIKLGTGFSSDYAVAVRNTAGTMISWGASDGHPYYYTRVPTAFSIRTVSFNPSSSTTVGPYKHVVISAPTLEEVDSAYNSMPVSIRAKNENKYYTPSELLGLEHAIAVDSGNGTYYAIKAASYNATQGTLVAWGAAGSDNALTVPTGSNFVSVSSRNRHAAARRTDNTIACWGLNSSNQAINPTGTYSSVACGDTFTVAIDSTTDKLTVWGSISVVPAPYSNIKFSTVSAGKAHIVGRALASYSEYVTDGMFSVSAGAVLAFGDNSKGQCNVPGFAYSGLNRSFVSPAVAGGDFTAYELATNGFNITPPVEGSIVFLDNAAENPESDSILDSERLEGHFIHKSGLLCPTILPSDHPFAINRPVTGRTPTGEATTRTVLYNTGFTEIFSLTTNATNVPSEFRRVGGSKKAKLIAAGRYRYHTQGLDRYPYGAGYSVLISEDNEVVVFGGDLLPSGCSAQNYDAPLEAIAIRNTDGAEITPEDDIIQISTYRGNIYALKSTGHLAHWGYDDVSSQYNPEFYRINDDLKKYFSLPDNSLQDVLPRLTQFIDSNIALSYISGIPNVTDSWSVDVYLNRYFNGQETNIKRFSAVGQSSLYGISNPVHFAETFLAIDTWPGEAQSLNSQYVLSIVPRGVSCTVNSASMFALNLDSKVGIQRVFRDGANMGSDMTQPADFLIAKRTGSNFTSSPLTLYNPVVVTAVTDSTSGIMLTSSSPFVSPSFIRNSYGGSAKLEFVNSWGTSASTGGRVAYPVLIDPSDIAGIKAWFKYETLPTTIGNFVSTWASSITAESINLAQSSAVLQPNVVSFNTSFFGAQFDNSNIDFLSASVEVSESSFTYFLVYSKPATSQNTHCAFGKYALPAAGSPRVQGIGFSLGRPVLLVGQTNDIATSAVSINTPGILCGYYGGTSDKGLRLNGTAISSYASVQNVSTMPNSGVGIGYHLGRSIAGPTTGLGNHDANDVYAEVVAVERRLTNAEIEIIEGFLAHKFNLQGGLPAGHTYKAAPPVYDSLDSIYPIDFLQDPFMLLESNRMTTSSGRSETWVGMFEVGVRHNTKRTANSGTTTLNHHAPLLAEFGVTIGITINPILEPITAVCNTTANLTVDSNSKYLVGRCECRSNVISAFVAKQKVLTSSLVLAFSSVTSFALTTRIGLRGFVFANLGVFGCEDYDLIYGCLGASNLGVDLTVSSPKEVLAPINAVLVTRASNFTRIVTLRFGIVECKLRTVVPPTGGGPQRLLNGSCFAISATNTPTLRTLNTRFEAAGILCVSKIQVCLPAFNVILRGSSNKPILPQPPVFPNTPID
jgi:alpha-tubulin suppressor-like RCC1 family protein